MDIPDFETLRKLGAGGQGTVWLARRQSDGLRAAIKIILHIHADNARARARFEQGVSVLAALDDPGIVRHLAFGTLPTGELWHATEFVPGRNLTEYLDDLDARFGVQRGSQSRLAVEEIVAVFVRVCRAVEAAHRVGVIHRDLKPTNIILRDDGEPVILDFGHATSYAGDDRAQLTVTGEFVGSPRYAAPEQVLCQPGRVDERPSPRPSPGGRGGPASTHVGRSTARSVPARP